MESNRSAQSTPLHLLETRELYIAESSSSHRSMKDASSNVVSSSRFRFVHRIVYLQESVNQEARESH